MTYRTLGETAPDKPEFRCVPQPSDVVVVKPVPVEDTSTWLETIKQYACWSLVHKGSFYAREANMDDACWKVTVYIRGDQRELFLTDKDMAHLAVILEPSNRKAWTKDDMFGFERPGMKFYIQSYMAPLVLQAFKTYKRDNP